MRLLGGGDVDRAAIGAHHAFELRRRGMPGKLDQLGVLLKAGSRTEIGLRTELCGPAEPGFEAVFDDAPLLLPRGRRSRGFAPLLAVARAIWIELRDAAG